MVPPWEDLRKPLSCLVTSVCYSIQCGWLSQLPYLLAHRVLACHERTTVLLRYVLCSHPAFASLRLEHKALATAKHAHRDAQPQGLLAVALRDALSECNSHCHAHDLRSHAAGNREGHTSADHQGPQRSCKALLRVNNATDFVQIQQHKAQS